MSFFILVQTFLSESRLYFYQLHYLFLVQFFKHDDLTYFMSGLILKEFAIVWSHVVLNWLEEFPK